MALTAHGRDSAGRIPSTPAMAGAAALALSGLLWSALMSVVTAPLAARVLGVTNFGLYRLALSVVTVATAVASGGLHNALLTIIPRRGERAGLMAETLGRAAWQAATVAGVLAAAIAIWRTPIAAAFGYPQAGLLLAVMAVSLPFLVLLAAVQAASRAAFAFAAAIVPGQIVRPALFAVLLVAAWRWDVRSPVTVAWLFTAAAAMAACIAGAAVSRVGQFGTGWLRPAWRIDREFITLMAPLMGLAILQGIQESLPVWLLGRLSTAGAIGLYAAAERMAFLVAVILTAINLVYAPAIGALWARAERERLRESFQRVARWTLAASLPVCLVLIVAGQGLLRVFGVEYQVAAPALTLLALGQLVNAGTGSVGYLLLLTGHSRTVVWDVAVAVMTLAGLGSVLVPSYGVTGAAGAVAVVVAGLNLLMAAQVRARLHVVPFTRDTLRVLAAGLVGAGGGLLTYRWAWMSSTPWFAGLVGSSIAVLGAYGLAVSLLMPDDDRDRLRQTWAALRQPPC